MRGHFTRLSLGATAVLVLAALALVGTAVAATVVTVTQNSSSWHPLDTRAGGTATFTEAYGAPPGLGSGSLELRTEPTTASKADYFTFAHAGTSILAVTDLAYWTYQPVTGQTPIAAPSYQLQLDLNGDGAGGFTTMVFEPYQNSAQGPIPPETWRSWNVDAGLLWSSRSFSEGTCTVVAGAGGPPLYTLAQLQAMCPGAVVLGIGVNVGTFNPGWTVATDGVQFNDVIYDFELGRRPAAKDECKNGGWETFNDPSFRNQGDCVSYMETGK